MLPTMLNLPSGDINFNMDNLQKLNIDKTK